MATYDDLAQKQEELVRKPLDGSAFFAPLTAPGIDEAFVGVGGVLAALPNDYGDLGLLTPDGMGFSREVANSDIMAFGRQTPVRSDITNDTTSLNIVAIETNLISIGMATGATILPGSRTANGALMIKKPPRPTPKQYRVLCLSVDNTEDGEIYIARYFPKAKVSGFSDQALGGTDNAIEWGTTLVSQFDQAAGFSEAWLFGGPGWNALLAKMGFTPLTDTVAPSVPTGLVSTGKTATSISLAWDSLGDAASYRLRRGGVDVTGATALTSPSYTDTGLTASTQYSYTVSAIDAAGNRSAESAAVLVTTNAV